MRRQSIAMLIGMALAIAGAAQAQKVERSGATFHKQACPGPNAPGNARCHAHIVTDHAGNPVVNAKNPNARNGAPAGYGPSDLRSAYNIPAGAGTGLTIAIVDAYGYTNAEHDVGVYRAQYGLPPCTTANGCFKKVNQNGGTSSYPKTNTGWDQEQALDLDMVSAICPGCKILLVQANTASYADLATAEKTAGTLGAYAISNSYGGGENGSQSYEQFYNQPGVAITVSSGDSGYGVQFPASSPHVTAVGGTTLSHASNARGWSETAWSGAGSGCSGVYPKPSWQSAITLCPNNRMEADTSAVADPNTPVAVYGPAFGNFSAWLEFGGTSVAAPLTAGIYGVNGAPVNYGADPYGHTSALNDVTSGSNGNCGNYLCVAGPGYDGPTGLGTPIGAAAF
jgi:subtilase family serine protease